MNEEIAIQAQQISQQLTQQLLALAVSVNRKYEFYNADNTVSPLGISIPVKMSDLNVGVGWASRAITTLGDRLNFDGFANDPYGLNTYMDAIEAQPKLDTLKTDCLIAGCSFALVSWNPEVNRYDFTPFTAQEATAVVDSRTGLVKIGLAVTEWGKTPYLPEIPKTILTSYPKKWLVTTNDWTARFDQGKLVEIVSNPTGRNLLHAFTHRRNVNRPLGKSRLTKTARRIIKEMARVKQRQEVAEEFYSTPQRYINGLANGAQMDANVNLAIGRMFATTKDEDGDKPEIGQLAQMSISGFTEAKKDLARDFCAETGLTLRNLGYETSNPTSAESLKTMSDDLLLEAQACQRELGEQIKQLVISLRQMADQNPIVPDGLKNVKPVWRPIFQSDAGATGDAVYKILQAMPEMAGSDVLYQMMGMGVREIEQIKQNRQQATFTTGRPTQTGETA